MTGGSLISRGHIYWILSNPIYVGRLRHKGQIQDCLHSAIIELEPWIASNVGLRSKRRRGRVPIAMSKRPQQESI
jgi:site-specific DNA recombinase